MEEDEPCALAFTDFNKPSPVLTGKSAERFLRMMEETNEAAKNPTPEMIAERARIRKVYEQMKAKTEAYEARIAKERPRFPEAL